MPSVGRSAGPASEQLTSPDQGPQGPRARGAGWAGATMAASELRSPRRIPGLVVACEAGYSASPPKRRSFSRYSRAAATSRPVIESAMFRTTEDREIRSP